MGCHGHPPSSRPLHLSRQASRPQQAFDHIAAANDLAARTKNLESLQFSEAFHSNSRPPTDTSSADWKTHALGTINAVLASPLQLRVKNVVGGGDQPWAVLELEADATCKNGMEYAQRYAWVLRFDEEGIVVQARAYLDSALVQKAVDSNA